MSGFLSYVICITVLKGGSAMKLGILIAVAIAGAAAALPAAAHEVIYAATLTGGAEIPTNTSPGSGAATVTLDLDTLMMNVHVTFAGLTSNATASHIHCCTVTPGANNVGVATMTPSFVDFPLTKAGTYDHTFDMALASSYNSAFVSAQGGVSNAFSALVAGMTNGNAYLNIHTGTFPGGEIRGLLHAVPEPETYGLLVVGLALLGWTTRRRARQV
jgi:hypothetical protein